MKFYEVIAIPLLIYDNKNWVMHNQDVLKNPGN